MDRLLQTGMVHGQNYHVTDYAQVVMWRRLCLSSLAVALILAWVVVILAVEVLFGS